MAATQDGILSAHVRFPDRETVIDALMRMEVVRGAAQHVWPPHRLPHGMFISPVTGGWVSLWSPLDNTGAWFPELTATLECPGLLIEVVGSEFWSGQFYQDGRLLGRVDLPSEAVTYDALMAWTADAFVEEGHDPETEVNPELFEDRANQILHSEPFAQEMRDAVARRPDAAALRPFVPSHGDAGQAMVELLAIDEEVGPQWEEVEYYAEDYAERFASYLGIRDATWSPNEDAEALAEGDYEEGEGLPEAWRDFLVVPIPHLPVLE